MYLIYSFFDSQLGDFLFSLSEFYQESGIQQIIIIDEWDVVFRVRKEDKDGQTYYLNFLRDWLKLEGDCPEDYPIQTKRHTREFLRDQAYLRTRTNLFGAVFRVRSVAAYAIHKYFQDNGYVYVHTPIITANDGEGAGQMFQVTTLDLDRIAKSGSVDYSKDFFNKKVGLAVTGQLEGETYALSYKKIYTFGPTFRAEKSNTKTHASEFWMIEAELVMK